MHEEIAEQARDMLTAAAKTEVPVEVRAVVQESVAKAREAYAKWNAGAHKGANVLEEVITLAQSSAKTVGKKALDNALANTEAAFDAADQLARAGTLQEVAQLQAKFVQTQMHTAGAQAKGLLELTLKVAKEAAEGLTAIATNAVGDLSKAVA